MEKLTRQEEQVMQAIWRTGEGVVKDFIANMDGAILLPIQLLHLLYVTSKRKVILPPVR